MSNQKELQSEIPLNDTTKEEQVKKELEIRERQLLQKNQELEHFVFSVSHDLKAPLVTLEGFSTIIIEDLCEGNECPCPKLEECKKTKKLKIRDAAMEINKAAHELSENIESLLELSRIGRLHIDRSKISPKKVIQSILKINKKYIEKTEAIIKINCTIPYINVQKEVFISILQNVISNALQHAKKKNQKELKINISIKKNKNDVLISIADNGKGVLKKEREKMFTTLSERGRGFGLAIIKKGIQWHNGKIWAESNNKKGTKINMLFPDCI